MKYAKIYSKNDLGQSVYKGEAVLLNCMDVQANTSFWEYKFVDGDNTTHCDWVDNDKVYEK